MVRSREPPRQGTLSRRALVAASVTATTVLAGCRSLPFGGEPVETGHLFVQNRADRAIEFALSVTERGEEGERIVYGRYRVPADHALQFADVLRPATTHRVGAVQPALDPGGGTTLTVEVETCSDADPSGKVDVAVSVSSNGPEISVFNCRTPYTRTGELTYVDASEHRIGTPAGPVASPTRS